MCQIFDFETVIVERYIRNIKVSNIFHLKYSACTLYTTFTGVTIEKKIINVSEFTYRLKIKWNIDTSLT